MAVLLGKRRRPWAIVLYCGAVASLSAPSAAGAQCASGVVLRPTLGGEAVAVRAARHLSIRTGWSVRVGPPPAQELLESVVAGELGLHVGDGRAELLLGGPGGQNFRATFVTPEAATEDDLGRAAALRAEALCEEASRAAPPRLAAADAPSVTFTGPMFPALELEAVAKPTVYLRLFGGYSATRGDFALGPGTGLGLCVARHCVVLEGELSLLPEQHATALGTIEYRPVFVGMRFQYRPVSFGRFTPGATLGAFTRMGNAVSLEQGDRQFLTSAGARVSTELAFRFEGAFEFVVEAGLDYTLDPARFDRRDAHVALDETLGAWASTAVRLRP